jgi:hypothetical protein
MWHLDIKEVHRRPLQSVIRQNNNNKDVGNNNNIKGGKGHRASQCSILLSLLRRGNATTSRTRGTRGKPWWEVMMQWEAEAPADGRWWCEGRLHNNQPDKKPMRGVTRDNGATMGRGTGRWEAAAWGEAMQKPAGLEAREAMPLWGAWREAMVQWEAESPADGRWRLEERQCNNQPDKREATQQPSGQEAWEWQIRRQRRNLMRGHATAMRDNRAGGRCNNQPWVGEVMTSDSRRVAGWWETTQKLAGADKNETWQEAEAKGRASWWMWGQGATRGNMAASKGIQEGNKRWICRHDVRQRRVERRRCWQEDERRRQHNEMQRNNHPAQMKGGVKDGHVRWRCNERWCKMEAAWQDATWQPAGEQEATGRRSGQEAVARCEAEAARWDNKRRWRRDNRGNVTTSKGKDMVEVVMIFWGFR